jgi:translation initiation factor IF-1
MCKLEEKDRGQIVAALTESLKSLAHVSEKVRSLEIKVEFEDNVRIKVDIVGSKAEGNVEQKKMPKESTPEYITNIEKKLDKLKIIGTAQQQIVIGATVGVPLVIASLGVEGPWRWAYWGGGFFVIIMGGIWGLRTAKRNE